MTTLSDAFLLALDTLIKEAYPWSNANMFSVKLPIDNLPVQVAYETPLRATSAHDVLQQALFLEQVATLFNPGNIGDQWLQSAETLWKPAIGFGLHTTETLQNGSYATKGITTDSLQPKFTFSLHERWKQIDNVSFIDGKIFKGNKSTIAVSIKTLKKQEELRRFFHLLSAFQGDMRLWRCYMFKNSLTLRAPSRAAACFMMYALSNSEKAMKSDTYAIELGYRVFCSPVETDAEIDAYQADMRAIKI